MGLLFLITFLLGVAGIVLFVRRDITGSFGVFDLERSLVLVSWLVAVTGAVLLAGVRPRGQPSALLMAGGVFFAIGALIAAAFEMYEIARGVSVTNDWVVLFVSLLLVGGALIGAGLLGSGLVPTWVAWTVIVWNLLWLSTLLLMSREDMYYPGIHYIPLLLIGIHLVGRRLRESPG